jgi:hypothetical protein
LMKEITYLHTVHSTVSFTDLIGISI